MLLKKNKKKLYNLEDDDRLSLIYLEILFVKILLLLVGHLFIASFDRQIFALTFLFESLIFEFCFLEH